MTNAETRMANRTLAFHNSLDRPPTQPIVLSMPTTATLIAETDIDPPLGNVFDTVLDAYRATGFEAGYHRAVNDLLADFALIAKECQRDHEDHCDEIRHALRDFHQRFEQHLEQTASTSRVADHYVDGGLGI
jgi:hypothetical protein